MITKELVKELIKDKLLENNCFLVEVDVKGGNNILLEIDSQIGITVEECVSFSRTIENNLDRENEDFELNVSSPGLDKPFRVKEQYIKNIGRTIKIVLNEGAVMQGELKEVGEDEIMIEYSFKEKIEGKKKKQTLIKQEKIKFTNIKETTVLISFK